MTKLALLLFVPVFLFGSKILSYNLYDRHDHVDVMLTFDTPYEGVLRQIRQGNVIIIKLEAATIDAPISKEITSDFLQKLSITPSNDQIQIVATVPANVQLQASKTSDSYGLRLRFNPPIASPSSSNSGEKMTSEASTLPTKQVNEFEQSYYVVIGILVVGIGILFWLKQGIVKKTIRMREEPKIPWLINTNKKTKPANTSLASSLEGGGVHIRFQKTLDESHSVAMLDFGTQSYLVLLGNNTILLDKFQDNIPISQNEFENMLKSKHQELDSFFQLGTTKDESFDAYKEKASGEY